MSNNDKSLDLIHKLIEVNKERISGYEKAAEATEAIDADIRSMFMRMALQSRQFIKEIKQHVATLGKVAHDTGALALTIRAAVSDLTTEISSQNRKMLLDFCLYIEQGAKQAYDIILNALEEKNIPVPEVAILVKTQRIKISKSLSSLQSFALQ
ncbi:MAG: PA2169 family four-helix-bundle protein [Chitinophagaceae bacterium]|nr:PA2169 family four-helix-bundle protein [Chitinophagaceae bacterium]